MYIYFYFVSHAPDLVTYCILTALAYWLVQAIVACPLICLTSCVSVYPFKMAIITPPPHGIIMRLLTMPGMHYC